MDDKEEDRPLGMKTGEASSGGGVEELGNVIMVGLNVDGRFEMSDRVEERGEGANECTDTHTGTKRGGHSGGRNVKTLALALDVSNLLGFLTLRQLGLRPLVDLIELNHKS